MDAGTARSLYQTASRTHHVLAVPNAASLLNANCNDLWANALNLHARGECDWFAMLHSDVVPEPWWLDTLVNEAEAVGADLLSVLVPIKDRKGLTSSGLSDPGHPIRPWCRFTLSQALHPSFPGTFDALAAAEALRGLPDDLRHDVPAGAVLYANTGCMAVRLSGRWPLAGAWFETRDRLYRMAGGRWGVEVLPEDWYFTSRVAAAGGRVCCTSRVKVHHVGAAAYPSREPWGSPRDLWCEQQRAKEA
jgi:hypothetical protein